MSQWLIPTTLTGKLVRMIPLEYGHRDALVEAASDGQLWNIWFTSVPSEETIDTYLDSAFQQQKAGTSNAFAIVHQASNQIIGSTRYCNMDLENYRLEIGYTWYAKSFQRTGVNTECKFLLLQHAFEVLSCIAVEFRTHWFNHPSRNAILRLGAKQDGVLRNHRISADGVIRDTVVFSILDREWKAVRKGLEYKMGRYD